MSCACAAFPSVECAEKTLVQWGASFLWRFFLTLDDIMHCWNTVQMFGLLVLLLPLCHHRLCNVFFIMSFAAVLPSVLLCAFPRSVFRCNSIVFIVIESKQRALKT